MNFVQINTGDKLIAINLDQIKSFYYDKDIDKTVVMFGSDFQIDYDTKNVFEELINLMGKLK